MNPGSTSVLETDLSWVFLIGDRVFKLRKPVRTAFVDLSTVEARRRACEDEVRLNRRLAPDVYLGVAAVVDDDGTIVDHLVAMRRMPDDRRLSTLVAAGMDVDGGVRDVARRVAALHLASPRSDAADASASAGATLARWEANHGDLERHAHLLADPGAPVRTLDMARTYIRGRCRLFAERIDAGRATDGHGELLADDIFVLDDGPRILDALEFDEGLRLGDGLADIASLAMDLERLGRGLLADRMLHWHGEFSADHWPSSLAHHYIAYRAQGRAKVAALRATQGGDRSAPDADVLLALAEHHLNEARVRLVLVGGPPGSGKTTLARHLADPVHWVVLRSDEVREELTSLGSQPSVAHVSSRIYEPHMTALTYAELLHRAAQLLERGETVVIDAAWADPLWRNEAHRVAQQCGSELIRIRCVTPVPVAAARVAARFAAGRGVSDATPEVARARAEPFAPWPDATPVDTMQPPEAAADAARALVAVG